LIPNPIRKVLSSMRVRRVRALLMVGQACVFYGAAEFSRDTDLAQPNASEIGNIGCHCGRSWKNCAGSYGSERSPPLVRFDRPAEKPNMNTEVAVETSQARFRFPNSSTDYSPPMWSITLSIMLGCARPFDSLDGVGRQWRRRLWRGSSHRFLRKYMENQHTVNNSGRIAR